MILSSLSNRQASEFARIGLDRRVKRVSRHAKGNRFRDYSWAASGWLWELDIYHRLEWISKSFSPDDHMVEAFEPGKPRWEIIRRGVSDTQWSEHRSLLERCLPFEDFRFEQLDERGQVHYLSVSGNAIIDAEGVFRGYRGTGQDITRQLLAERALNLAKEAAVSANEVKSQFLANMSHELRTPLNAILGFAEIISEALVGPLDTRYQAYAKDIYLAGRHLLRIVEDILDLSKIEAGRMELQEEGIDLNQLMASCRKLLLARAKAASVTLELDRPEGLQPIVADHLRLSQVLLNLLANAVKFTPPGGLVRICAQQSAEEGIVISVADTGVGMRPQDIPIAMTPFRQLEEQLVHHHEGTGLGLPIAKMLVELHGGTLDIKSQPGQGTTVRIRLPKERMMAAPFNS